MDEVELLRTYIQEALQLELRVDPHMMALLRGSDIRPKAEHQPLVRDAHAVAKSWLEDVEERRGEVSPYHRTRIFRYAARKWPVLLHRFRGDRHAATQTLYNLLDMRSSEGG